MGDCQLYPGIPSRSYTNLTEKGKPFIDYFTKVKINTISQVMNEIYTAAPKGYGSFLMLARMIKIKEQISSDRELDDKTPIANCIDTSPI